MFASFTHCRLIGGMAQGRRGKERERKKKKGGFYRVSSTDRNSTGGLLELGILRSDKGKNCVDMGKN